MGGACAALGHSSQSVACGGAHGKAQEVPVWDGRMCIPRPRGGWGKGAGGRVKSGRRSGDSNTTNEEGGTGLSWPHGLLQEVHPELCQYGHPTHRSDKEKRTEPGELDGGLRSGLHEAQALAQFMLIIMVFFKNFIPVTLKKLRAPERDRTKLLDFEKSAI